MLTIATIFAIIFFFSACEKEMQEFTIEENNITSELLIDDSNLPSEEVVLEEKTIKPFEDADNFMIREKGNFDLAQKRSYLTKYRNISYHNYQWYKIRCADQKISDTHHGYTRLNNNDFYNYWGLHTELHGRDQTYYFDLTEESIVEFKLTEAHANLALLLFKGDYAYDNHNHRVKEVYKSLKAYSTSSSHSRELLGPIKLEPGKYILVVDSRYGYGSSYKLNVYCTPVYKACHDQQGYQLRYEDYQHYYNGGLVAQHAPNWELWNPHNPYNDAKVTTTQHPYDKVMKICRDPHKNSINQPDVIYNLGESRHGIYELSFDMGIYQHRSGYFDIQKVLTHNNNHNEVGPKFYFKSDGRAYIKVGGREHWFHYKNGYWFNVKIKFDFLSRKAGLYIDGHFICDWTTTLTWDRCCGSNQIEGINFYPKYTNSCFLVDNICFSAIALI